MDVLKFVSRVEEAVEAKRKPPEKVSGPKIWSFCKTFLRYPEMRCPKCEGTWINPWVWIIDTQKMRVLKIWDRDGQKVDVYDAHPHVEDSGYICLGAFRDPVQALTTGFNNRSNFGNFWDRMAGLGHSREECTESWGGVCYECGDELDEGDGYTCGEDGYLRCDSCNSGAHEYCNYCDGTIHTHLGENGWWVERSERTICSYCYEEYHFICKGCDEIDSNEYKCGEGYCQDCHSERFRFCEGCQEDVHIDTSMCAACGRCADDCCRCQEEEENDDQ